MHLSASLTLHPSTANYGTFSVFEMRNTPLPHAGVAQSNLLNILSGSTVNGFYVAGALLIPYSWGLHVASWIQKQNGK